MKKISLFSLLVVAIPAHASWHDFFTYLAEALKNADQQAYPVKPVHTQTGQSLDYYLHQFKQDLAGLEYSDIQAIVSYARQSLQSINGSISKEYADQILRAALVEHGRVSAYKKAKQLGAPDSFADRFANSMQGNILARIERAQHINGQAYVQFFGKELEFTLKKELANYTPQTAHYQAQKPVMPVYASFPLDKHLDMMRSKLREIKLSESDISYLIASVSRTLSARAVTEQNAIPLTKAVLKDWFDQVIIASCNQLRNEVVDSSKLREGCDQVRRLLNSKEGIDMESAVFGVAKLRKFTPTEVTETILDNTDKLRCSICTEYYVEEMRTQGKVNRIELSCPSKHRVCADDAQWSIMQGTCPECKARVNVQHIKNQIVNLHRPSAPAMGS
ncbi:hypothetical protein Noda2021_05410 [Candidatus Dependentiae bacterium Noda2021]|nr:hypothetical protein Noda2021_05410 [Candidatus Dependentiae bacterium Noda2021]